jgi:hypothetical protein
MDIKKLVGGTGSSRPAGPLAHFLSRAGCYRFLGSPIWR